MIVRIDKGFQKDVSRISDSKLKNTISEIIENIRQAENLLSIPGIKKLTGYKEFYRIKTGNYRIGLEYTKDHEIILIRFLDRKEIYRRWL
jgi:mRNA interferase RelE/StbE